MNSNKHKIIIGQFDEYIINEKVGQGAVGIVYKGQICSNGQPCAIKHLIPTRFEITDAIKKRFREEIELICNKIDSQYFVKGLDYFDDGENIYLIMEWLSNGQLLQRIATQEFDKNLLTKWVCQLLKCFKDLRLNNIVHRDIKPNNILLDKFDNIKLCDFGIAIHEDKDIHLTFTGDIMGSVLYISPLQRKHPEKATCKDDFFSLCAVFYELISGERIHTSRPSLRLKNPHNIPILFTKLVDKALQYIVSWEDVFNEMCRIYDIENDVLNEEYIKISSIPVISSSTRLKVLHLVFSKNGYGGIETYIETIKKYSSNVHFVKSIFEFGVGSYPNDYGSFKKATQKTLAELKLENRFYEKTSNSLNQVSQFLEDISISHYEENEVENNIYKLGEIIEELDGFDLIHSHFLLPAYISNEFNFKMICTSHSLISKELSYRPSNQDILHKTELINCKTDERVSVKNIKNIIVLSKAHMDELSQIGGNNIHLMKPIFDISNFEDPSVVSMTSSIARKKLGLPNKTTIMFIGRGDNRKGFDLLIKAFENIPIENIQLMIVSKDIYLNFIDKTISYGNNKINIDEKIITKILQPVYSGSREQIALFFKSADIVVCPSLYEPFGYVNLETMAARRALIASNIGGINEIVKDGYNGLLFKQGDEVDLHNKLKLLINDVKLQHKLSEHGFTYIKNTYNIIEQIKEIDEKYEQVYYTI